MATKKTTTKSRTTKRKTSAEEVVTSVVTPTPKNRRFILNLLIVILIGAIVFLFAKRYRHLVLAGIVNKAPISRFELNQALVREYGTQVFDTLVEEKLWIQAGKENQIEVTEEDINNEIKTYEERLGGKEALEAAMLQSNMDQKSLRKTIKVNLTQKKLAQKLFTAEVTEEEVQKFYDDNKEIYFKDKTFDQAKEEINTGLKDQKVYQQLGTWFQEFKTKAQIVNYLTQ